ncbi:MAG: hypothetical protein WC635_12755 [Bacteriovorax sp.]|jgi:hypothetical protein
MVTRIIFLVSISGIFNNTFAYLPVLTEEPIIFSEDEKVVYLNPKIMEANSIGILIPNKYSRDEFSTKNYPQSGVYQVKGRKLLYPIDKNKTFHDGSKLFNNGKYLVANSELTSKIEDMALELFKEGKLIKSFKVKDFCRDESTFVFNKSEMITFTWKRELRLDNFRKEITFIACNKLFKIDIATGKISSISLANLGK